MYNRYMYNIYVYIYIYIYIFKPYIYIYVICIYIYIYIYMYNINICIIYIYVYYVYLCNIYIYIYICWNYKALHHMHHITTRCASYINRYKDRCKETHMHAYIRPKHACTRACRHKGSPLSFIMLPLFLLLALQCTTSRNTYKQTKMPA